MVVVGHTEYYPRFGFVAASKYCEEAVEWLAERGGYCDCEVLFNVEPPDDCDAIQASTRAYERIIEAVEKHDNAKWRMR